MNNENNGSIAKRLKYGIAINTGFTIFEFVVGFMSGSLALISDAAHNLTDSLSLVISFFGNKISATKSDTEHSYGHGRAGILTGLLNALILLGLALFIFYEAYLRILKPSPVAGKAIVLVALAGIFVNGSIAYLFRNSTKDLNMKSAYLNMAFDTLASVGALIAGFLIMLTGKTVFDPIISIIIGGMLIVSAVSVVKDALHILLEGVPKGLDPVKVRLTIGSIPSVISVNDLHIWSLSSHEIALSCHVLLEEETKQEIVQTVDRIKSTLLEQHGIGHATIEVGLEELKHDH